MPYVTDLPRALKARGLTVEVVPGWQTRGSAIFNPYGAVCHWTAGPRTGDRPSLNVCVNGRPGLPGPLCNVFLTRAGVAVVVAAGRANHAGKGGWRGLVGNSSVFGTEAENSGGGEWTKAQRWAYPRINAAYVDLGARPANVCGHNEWAPTRKIDIRDWPMPAMRSSVAALLTTAGSRIPDLDTPEDDMPYERDELIEIVREALHGMKVGRTNMTAGVALERAAGKPMLSEIGAAVSEVVLPQFTFQRLWHEQRTLRSLAALLARDPSTVTAKDIAAAIPENIAGAVADELATRLKGA